jgi:hypothetical protein
MKILYIYERRWNTFKHAYCLGEGPSVLPGAWQSGSCKSEGAHPLHTHSQEGCKASDIAGIETHLRCFNVCDKSFWWKIFQVTDRTQKYINLPFIGI